MNSMYKFPYLLLYCLWHPTAHQFDFYFSVFSCWRICPYDVYYNYTTEQSREAAQPEQRDCSTFMLEFWSCDEGMILNVIVPLCFFISSCRCSGVNTSWPLISLMMSPTCSRPNSIIIITIIIIIIVTFVVVVGEFYKWLNHISSRRDLDLWPFHPKI